MKVEWDYSALAAFYDKRADYSSEAIQAMLLAINLPQGSVIADVGAGTGKLSVPLLRHGFRLIAVEPNDDMRFYGQKNTQGKSIEWREGTGEETSLDKNSVYAFLMGSSFNVVDKVKCLKEAARVLKDGGWFGCMWNHRDLDDPLQKSIETIITSYIANYSYGSRREDPTEHILQSNLFAAPHFISDRFYAEIKKEDFIDGWRSHATLQRQAGDNFDAIIGDIIGLLDGQNVLNVPYSTNIWVSRKL